MFATLITTTANEGASAVYEEQKALGIYIITGNYLGREAVLKALIPKISLVESRYESCNHVYGTSLICTHSGNIPWNMN